jgi:hypothetical protein
VPTLRGAGRSVGVREWYAFFMPAQGQRRDRVSARRPRCSRSLAQPEVVEFGSQFGLEAQSSTPRELAELLKRDAAEWGGLVKQTGFHRGLLKTRSVRLAEPAVVVERLAGGALRLRSPQPLGRIREAHRAARALGRAAPERVFLAQRSVRVGGASPMRRRARARGGSRRRCSGAACRPNGRWRCFRATTSSMPCSSSRRCYAGVAYAPVSPAYSLVSSDFAQLRRAMELVTPA